MAAAETGADPSDQLGPRSPSRYDQMLKYATAIRTGTASTEAILRRFMKANAAHPTYQAMIELGRAQKDSFLARSFARGLQREINDGLNVIESWNHAATRSSSTAR